MLNSLKIARLDPYLDEAIQILNLVFEKNNGDSSKAYAALGPAERRFIDGEISRCLVPGSGLRYYLQNYHVIRSEYEGLMTMRDMWDSQEIFLSKVMELMQRPHHPSVLHGPIRMIVLKARQLGLSTVSEGLCFYKTIFTPSCTTLVVAQDPGQSDYLFTMARRAYENLPWWFRPEARYEAKAKYLVFDRKDPIERQVHPGLGSEILVESANKQTGVAVGKTFRVAHMSELSAWGDPEALTTQIFPSMNALDAIAIMESTARGRKGFWYNWWRDVLEGKISGWEPVFIEFFRVRKYSLPIAKGASFSMTQEELGIRQKVQEERGVFISDEQFNWRRNKIAEVCSFQGDEWKFFEQYPGATWQESFQGTGLCAFDKRKLQKLRETSCCNPRYVGEIDLEHGTKEIRLGLRPVQPKEQLPPAELKGTRLRVWLPPEEGESYYVGADVAHGVEGGNYSCAQVLKIGRGPEPDVQVAEWHGWINPDPYASVLAALGHWYNKAQVCVECNDVGIATNNKLMRVLEYENLYQWKHFDKIKNYLSDFLGWYTNTKTRDQIIAKFDDYIDEDMVKLYSAELIEECFDFSRDEGSSKFQGQEGDDDRVMAMMIALFCVAPETLVLTSDLRWVELGNCRAGDELLAFDENLDDSRFRRSRINSHEIIYQPRFEVITDRGTVVTTAGHRWACRVKHPRKGFVRCWYTTDALHPGSKIYFLATPWDVDLSPDAQWLSGLLDGEGYVGFGHDAADGSYSGRGRGRITLAQNPGIVLDRALSVCAAKGIKATHRRTLGNKLAGDCRTIDLRLDSPYQALELIGRLRPIRLLDNVLRQWVGQPFIKFHWPTPVATVLEVRPIGIGPVVAVGTETKTLFTNGLASHNCAHDSDYGQQASIAPRFKKIVARKPNDPDWVNTDWSPVHDKPGVQQKLFYENEIPAEATHEMALYSGVDWNETVKEDSDDAWKLL